jgi:hypothetical protein
MSRAIAWASARSLMPDQKRTRVAGPGGPARDIGAPLRGRHHRVGRVQQISAVAPGRLQDDFPWAQSRRSHAEAARHGAHPCSSSQESTVETEPRMSAADQRTLRRAGVLELVDEQVREAVGDCVGERGSLTEQSAQLEDRIDVVHRPASGASSHAARRSPRTHALAPRNPAPSAWCPPVQRPTAGRYPPSRRRLRASIRSTIRASSPAGFPRISWRAGAAHPSLEQQREALGPCQRLERTGRARPPSRAREAAGRRRRVCVDDQLLVGQPSIVLLGAVSRDPRAAACSELGQPPVAAPLGATRRPRRVRSERLGPPACPAMPSARGCAPSSSGRRPPSCPLASAADADIRVALVSGHSSSTRLDHCVRRTRWRLRRWARLLARNMALYLPGCSAR